jgi:FkbM family methyltransferase
MQTNKLKNFPSVYYISLEESKDRHENIVNQFSEYGIIPTAILSKRFSECDDEVTGKLLHQLNGGTIGTIVSHLKSIRKWYEETNEDYAFFCEDDLSLETVKYWDFTWEEFIESIPDDVMCVQLHVIREEYETFDLRKREWNDWAATAFILNREYAKILIDTYCVGENKFNLELPSPRDNIMPLGENILYTTVENVAYSIPLFVEEIKFNSTFSSDDDADVQNGQKTGHVNSYHTIINYWKNRSNTKESHMNIEELLTKYSHDTENDELNFELGMWYESQGHTAPAVSYYLRCAERSENSDLAYEALLRCYFCYERQGERNGSSRSMLFQAQAFRPDRPEAYFLMSQYSEKREWWQDCYMDAHLALLYCNFDQQPLRTDIGYPGKYGLLFEKAISGWWWGKVEECKSIFLDLKNNYPLNEHHRKLVDNNLKNIFKNDPNFAQKDFGFKQDFSWGDLSYEDIITIEREIINEKVYRFWEDVKEGDIVLDIGASVGAYTVSILDQKPKKVYCVEPSKKLLKTLSDNCFGKTLEYLDNPLVYINYGIVDKDTDKINIFGGEDAFKCITFKKLIEDYSIDHVNYMKVDCEGGEYSIFKQENMNFLLNKVDFISIEMHLNYSGCREKFKEFRDKYLIQFKNYKVMSCTRQNISWGNSLDLKDKIFDNDFIDNYSCEFMIYVKNI